MLGLTLKILCGGRVHYGWSSPGSINYKSRLLKHDQYVGSCARSVLALTRPEPYLYKYWSRSPRCIRRVQRFYHCPLVSVTTGSTRCCRTANLLSGSSSDASTRRGQTDQRLNQGLARRPRPLASVLPVRQPSRTSPLIPPARGGCRTVPPGGRQLRGCDGDRPRHLRLHRGHDRN